MHTRFFVRPIAAQLSKQIMNEERSIGVLQQAVSSEMNDAVRKIKKYINERKEDYRITPRR